LNGFFCHVLGRLIRYVFLVLRPLVAGKIVAISLSYGQFIAEHIVAGSSLHIQNIARIIGRMDKMFQPLIVENICAPSTVFSESNSEK
jgi:hypothetical protein